MAGDLKAIEAVDATGKRPAKKIVGVLGHLAGALASHVHHERAIAAHDEHLV